MAELLLQTGNGKMQTFHSANPDKHILACARNYATDIQYITGDIPQHAYMVPTARRSGYWT
jgi:hypothetical protein